MEHAVEKTSFATWNTAYKVLHFIWHVYVGLKMQSIKNISDRYSTSQMQVSKCDPLFVIDKVLFRVDSVVINYWSH